MKLMWALTLCVTLAMTSCSSSDRPDDVEPTRLSFWKENAPANYEIVWSRSHPNGMGGMPDDGTYQVEVKDGSVLYCTAELVNAPSQTQCPFAVSDPVSKIFGWMAQLPGAHTSITYHPEWQFPTEVIHDDPAAADEEVRIRVHRFEVLEDV